MKHFIDTEFIEGTQREMFPISLFRKETKPTIDLISIGIVSEDDREYYAISKDFNLKEAWNRWEWKRRKVDDGIEGVYKDYWIRDNVLNPIHKYLCKNVGIHGKTYYWNLFAPFTYKSMQNLIRWYGKTNEQIAQEVKEFCTTGVIISNDGLNKMYYKEYGESVKQYITNEATLHNVPIHHTTKPEFYGYFADYDWVVFCWLFGKMIDLPKTFPMYCIDLKQELENFKYECSDMIEQWGHGVQKHPLYPKQTGAHDALCDAHWNKKLYEFLNNM